MVAPSLNTPWQCRQCKRPHVLTDAQEVERRTGPPITTRCECGALYQITRDVVRCIAYAPGFYCVVRDGGATWVRADQWRAGDVLWDPEAAPIGYGPAEGEHCD